MKSALAGDPRTKAHQINVETREGVVQLSGFVDNSEAKSTAEELARAVDHVKSRRQRARRQEVSFVAKLDSGRRRRGRSGDTPAPFYFDLQDPRTRSDFGAAAATRQCDSRDVAAFQRQETIMKTENRIERFTTHWQKTFKDEPYYSAKYSWDDFDPAYRYAYKSYEENPERALRGSRDAARGRLGHRQGQVETGVGGCEAGDPFGLAQRRACLPGDADRDGR